mmetsp:Transcript_40408/g.91214  ORF Transcript_40408/g.91214 Transcript_40408/m.91214 type:complete len:184 (-) Transcript_40408:63-614(-)
MATAGEKESRDAYHPFLACRSGAIFWGWILCCADLYFTVTGPPVHIPQHYLLACEIVHSMLTFGLWVMTMQLDEVGIKPFAKQAAGLQRAVGKVAWFLSWPCLSWTLATYLAILAGMRSVDKYLLGGVWCDWLTSFWTAFSTCTFALCALEAVVSIFGCVFSKVCCGCRCFRRVAAKEYAKTE